MMKVKYSQMFTVRTRCTVSMQEEPLQLESIEINVALIEWEGAPGTCLPPCRQTRFKWPSSVHTLIDNIYSIYDTLYPLLHVHV